MYIGMLTAPFQDKSLEYVIDFADTANIKGIEVITYPGSPHIDPTRLDNATIKRIRDKLEEKNKIITALAYYAGNIADPKEMSHHQEMLKHVINSANKLQVGVVCTLAGFPMEGTTKIEMIRKVLPKAFRPVLNHAKKKNVKIALENWYRTNLQGLDTFEELFKAIPDEHLGLNYDPSHLVHQECDYFLPVTLFKERIFHTHAKDTLIDHAKKSRVGIYGDGWWRYVLPGFGCIRWGEYINHLAVNGYTGVLSIEHEDASFSRENGFIRATWFLEAYC